MVALVVDNLKLIALLVLVGTVIGLSKFGGTTFLNRKNGTKIER
jgi:hypothetical protein